MPSWLDGDLLDFTRLLFGNTGRGGRRFWIDEDRLDFNFARLLFGKTGRARRRFSIRVVLEPDRRVTVGNLIVVLVIHSPPSRALFPLPRTPPDPPTDRLLDIRSSI